MKRAVEARTLAESLTRFRVRYPEADRMGVAYHANYYVWFELGRTELMRELGCAYAALEDEQQIFFPVVEATARYVVPAHYDDELEVETRLIFVGGARVIFEYRLTRGVERTLMATGSTEHASVGPDGRPRRMPEELRARLVGASR